MNELILGFGFFLIIEGLLYAAAPFVVKNLAALLPTVSDDQLRLSGLVAMALGVAVVWVVHGT